MMRANPRKIKHLENLIRVHGNTLTKVLCDEMGMTLTAFAKKYGFYRELVSKTVNAHRYRVHQPIRNALAEEAQITPGELDRLIDAYADVRPPRPTEK